MLRSVAPSSKKKANYQGRIQGFHLGGGGGALRIICVHAQYERKARSPFRPGSSARLTLKRLGYFGGWKDWGGGALEISAVDRAIAAKICTMVVCDVIYKIVYLDFPKYFNFILY